MAYSLFASAIIVVAFFLGPMGVAGASDRSGQRVEVAQGPVRPGPQGVQVPIELSSYGGGPIGLPHDFEYIDHSLDKKLSVTVAPGVSQLDWLFANLRNTGYPKCFGSASIIMAEKGRGLLGQITLGTLSQSRYVIACSGDCRGLRYRVSGIVRLNAHLGLSRPYPVLDVNLPLQARMTIEFSGPSALSGRRVSVYHWGLGSFGDYGAGCRIVE